LSFSSLRRMRENEAIHAGAHFIPGDYCVRRSLRHIVDYSRKDASRRCDPRPRRDLTRTFEYKTP
jgi:hypothetical protein